MKRRFEHEESSVATLQTFWKACRDVNYVQVKEMLDRNIVSPTDSLPGREKTIFHHIMLYAPERRGILKLLLSHTTEQLDVSLLCKLCPRWGLGMSDSFKLLLSHQKQRSACFQFEYDDHKTVFHMLPSDVDSDLVAALVAGGADINTQDEVGCTALHIAAHTGDCRLLRALLESGAQTEIVNAAGCTPLVMQWTPVSSIETLLSFGANIHARGPDNTTVLHMAVSTMTHDVIAKVQVLLDAGMDVNAITWRHSTALHFLCGAPDWLNTDFLALLSLLLRHGANAWAKDLERVPPFALAIRRFIHEFPNNLQFRLLANIGLDMLSLFIAHGVSQTDLQSLVDWNEFEQILSDTFDYREESLYAFARRQSMHKLL